jgi:arginase
MAASVTPAELACHPTLHTIRPAASRLDISIVCVPYHNDVGRWGQASGPAAFLQAGLVERLRERGHSVREPAWAELPAAARGRDVVANLTYLAGEASRALRKALEEPDGFAIALLGDCSHAVGVIGGVSGGREAAGVCWFDAHGDLCTRATTTSGYWSGMPLAVALGWDLDDWRLGAGLETPIAPAAAALVGTSDLDPAEVEELRRHPSILHVDAERLSAGDWERELVGGLEVRARHAGRWLLHVDVDVAGPEEVPGCLTPAPSWAPRTRLVAAARAAAGALPVRALSLSGYNPMADTGGLGVHFGLEMALAALDRLVEARPLSG